MLLLSCGGIRVSLCWLILCLLWICWGWWKRGISLLFLWVGLWLFGGMIFWCGMSGSLGDLSLLIFFIIRFGCLMLVCIFLRLIFMIWGLICLCLCFLMGLWCGFLGISILLSVCLIFKSFFLINSCVSYE